MNKALAMLGLAFFLNSEPATPKKELVIEGKTELEEMILKQDVKVDSFVVSYSDYPDAEKGEAFFITHGLGDSVSYAELILDIPQGPKVAGTLWGRLVPELKKDYSNISGKFNFYRLNENTYPLEENEKTLIQFWNELIKDIPEMDIVSVYSSEVVKDVVREIKVEDGKRQIKKYDFVVNYLGLDEDSNYLLVKFFPLDGGLYGLGSVYMYLTRDGKMAEFEINMKFPLKNYTARSKEFYKK